MFLFLSSFLINHQFFSIYYIQQQNIFIILGNLIFFLGILGIILNQRNFLISMLFIEVMYIGIFTHFLILSTQTFLPLSQIFALCFLVVIACESVIGLGILLILYRYDKSINIEFFTDLRG